MIRYLDDETQRYQREPEAAQRLMKVGIAPPPASDAVTETAAWTSVARIILNLSETLTRN
jgi:hypothetical protein